jgi:hypothetical protein
MDTGPRPGKSLEGEGGRRGKGREPVEWGGLSFSRFFRFPVVSCFSDRSTPLESAHGSFPGAYGSL